MAPSVCDPIFQLGAYSWVPAAEERPKEGKGRRLERSFSLSGAAKGPGADLAQTTCSPITSEIERFFSEIQEERVAVPHPSLVRSYLIRHPDMLDLMARACEIASDHFGSNRCQLSLELYRDPEIEDEYVALYVRPYMYTPQILDEIDAACAEYESDLTGKSGWFAVTTDFRHPR